MLLDRLQKTTRSKMVFFVGAGISIPSDVLNFQKLGKKIIQDITDDKLRDDEAELLSQNLRPEVILQVAVEELGPMVLHSLQMLKGHRPNPNHLFLAQALRSGNWVFTTNIDNLIEEACRQTNVKVERCYEDGHFEKFERHLSGLRDVPGCLFKLHGTIEADRLGDERYRTILMALRQVGRGLSEPKKRVLSHFLRHFDFCFMGYSCQDDFSVVPLLTDTDSDRSIFWLSYARTPIDEPVSDKKAFQQQRDAEESKTPGEKRDWETINVNSFLLRRDRAFKFIGDSSRFVEDVVCPTLRIDTRQAAGEELQQKEDSEYAQWASRISDCKQRIISGRLYQSLYDLGKAEFFYKQAENSAQEDKQKAIALRRLGQIYLIPSTREDDEKAIEIFQKAVAVFDELGDSFEVACTKTDLSNALRRRRRFSEATQHVEEAKLMFENDILPSIEKEDEEYHLAYARCLNVLGLVYFGLGSDSKSTDHLQVALKLCEKSRQIKEKFGDVDGIAESDNGIALTLMEEARVPGKSEQEATQQLDNAAGHLETAISARERIGNFRGCFQHCRNLGLAHSRLANLASDRSEKEKYIRLSKKDYEDGLSYLNRIRPEPPVGEVLECQFRIGELCVQLGEKSEAVRWLKPLESKRREAGDWHNRARTLDLLREAYVNTDQRKYTGSEILSIYRDVLGSHEKIKEMRDTRIRLTNANDILQKTAEALEDMGFSKLANEALRIREALTWAVEQDKKP